MMPVWTDRYVQLLSACSWKFKFPPDDFWGKHNVDFLPSHPVRKVLLGWVIFKGMSLACHARRCAFLVKHRWIWSLSLEWATILIWGLSWFSCSLLYPSGSLPIEGVVKKLAWERAWRWTSYHLDIRTRFHGAPSFSWPALASPAPSWELVGNRPRLA